MMHPDKPANTSNKVFKRANNLETFLECWMMMRKVFLLWKTTCPAISILLKVDLVVEDIVT
jgi:hypothetical protein